MWKGEGRGVRVGSDALKMDIEQSLARAVTMEEKIEQRAGVCLCVCVFCVRVFRK